MIYLGDVRLAVQRACPADVGRECSGDVSQAKLLGSLLASSAPSQISSIHYLEGSVESLTAMAICPVSLHFCYFLLHVFWKCCF